MRLSPPYALGAFSVWALFVAIQLHGSDAAVFRDEVLTISRYFAIAALLVLTPRVLISLAAAARGTSPSWARSFLVGMGAMVVIIVASIAFFSNGGVGGLPQHLVTLLVALGLGCIASPISVRLSRLGGTMRLNIAMKGTPSDI